MRRLTSLHIGHRLKRLLSPARVVASSLESRQTKQELKETKRELKETKRKLKETRQELRETREELYVLTRELYVLDGMPKGSVCAEVGVHEGEFSRRILDTVKPKRLHLIDPWKHELGDQYHGAWYGGCAPEGQATLDERYRRVKEQLAKEISADQVRIHRKPSSVASDDFEDLYFDWIYIDGNHLYEFVKQDLERYYPKVKVGGYIAGDDYGTKGWWENGVQKAVDEFVLQRQDLTLEVKGEQFVITKSMHPGA